MLSGNICCAVKSLPIVNDNGTVADTVFKDPRIFPLIVTDALINVNVFELTTTVGSKTKPCFFIISSFDSLHQLRKLRLYKSWMAVIV